MASTGATDTTTTPTFVIASFCTLGNTTFVTITNSHNTVKSAPVIVHIKLAIHAQLQICNVSTQLFGHTYLDSSSNFRFLALPPDFAELSLLELALYDVQFSACPLQVHHTPININLHSKSERANIKHTVSSAMLAR